MAAGSKTGDIIIGERSEAKAFAGDAALLVAATGGEAATGA
jgi:hypothetical protein